jgi:hypothetical protein
MEFKPKLSRQELVSQLSFETLEKKFGKILVHSLPNGKTLPEDELIPGFTTNPSFETALDKCLNESLENLCCSSVSQGDDYNRWGGSPFGLYLLDGVITACFKSDANSWHKSYGEVKDLPTSSEIIKKMRKKDERTIDEIQIRTNSDMIIPYFDLDLLVSSVLRWGFDSLETERVNKTCKEELARYLEAMKSRDLPSYYLYHGKLGKIDLEELFKIVEPIQYGYQGDSGDDQEYEMYRTKFDRFKASINTIFVSMDRGEIIIERGKSALKKLKART